METYKSDKHVIDCDIATVYSKLSNPEVFRRHMEENIDKLPEEARTHLQNLKFEEGGVVIESPMGPLKLGIVETVEPSKIVFGAAQSPVPFGLVIELKEIYHASCHGGQQTERRSQEIWRNDCTLALQKFVIKISNHV